MRLLCLCILLLSIGCGSNDVAVLSFDQHELESPVDSSVSEPHVTNVPSTFEIAPPVEFVQSCQCEWDSWTERGLYCIGQVCNEYCSQEVLECYQSREACIAP